jgi:hypothetical protein
MPLTRLELAAGAGMLLLVGAGLTRVATRNRPGLRPLSIEGVQIASEPIGTGQTIVREQHWRPPADVYVLGWAYSIGNVGASPELLLLHKETVLFFGAKGAVPASNPAFYGEGAGYRVPAGEAVTLRLTMTNTGAPGQTRGAEALLYFVPVEGN